MFTFVCVCIYIDIILPIGLKNKQNLKKIYDHTEFISSSYVFQGISSDIRKHCFQYLRI